MNVVVFSSFVLKHTKLDIILVALSGNTNKVAETVKNFSIIASSSHSVDSQQARIIPSVDMLVKDQFMQFSLRENSVSKVQS